MSKKTDLQAIVEETMSDLNDRLDNLEAIKGENFSKAVKLSISIYSVLRVATTNQLPAVIRDELLTDMLAGVTAQMCVALGLDIDSTKEAMHFAEGMSKTLETQGERASEVLKS